MGVRVVLEHGPNEFFPDVGIARLLPLLFKLRAFCHLEEHLLQGLVNGRLLIDV